MDVTVIVCTWNRAHSIARGLAAIARLEVPARCDWELLVVDNGSTDRTGAVLDNIERAGRLPLRVIKEPRLGLSRARNAGVAAARGNLLLFTDDDTFVDPGWLRAYVAAAQRWPQATYFGGPVAASFERPAPRWVTRNLAALRPMLCVVEITAKERPITLDEQPFGPNMAFRREAFEAIRFDEGLGRRGNQHIRGSEVGVVNELKRTAVQGIWVPEACVQHFVPPDHASLRYLWNYHAGAGATAVRLDPPEHSLRVPAEFRIAKGVAAAALKIVMGRSDWVVYLGRTAYYVGLRRERIRVLK